MRTIALSALGFAVILASPAAFAQARGGQQAAAPREQTFNFTDELVQGSMVRPDGATTRVRRQTQGVSLIRIREHFYPEMLKSVENL